MKTSRHTGIKNRHSGQVFDRFPIVETWGVMVLTHDHRVLHMKSEEHFSGSAKVTWIDITGDYEIIENIKHEKKSDKETGCCGSNFQGPLERPAVQDNKCPNIEK